MKKVLLIIFILLSLSITSLYIVSYKKNTGIEFYSPYEATSYVLSSDREISFDIYSKEKTPIILNINKNTYTLKMDNLSILLEDIRISSFEIDDYYLIKLYAKSPDILFDEYHSQKTELVIENYKYKLTLPYGPISFLKEDTYKLLSIDSLSGSYSYINKTLTLVGINITLNDSYTFLNSIRIGNNVIGNLNNVVFDIEVPNIVSINEIIEDYSPTKLVSNSIIGIQSKKLFIPLGYKALSILRSGYMVFKLDNELYYVDTFSFMTNSLEFNSYKEFMTKGELIYA